MSNPAAVDEEMKAQIEKYGLDEILAAIGRYCYRNRLNRTFNRLNKLYDWYINARLK